MSGLALLLHAMLMAAAGPILAGVQAWAQAGWRGEARPPVQQPWRDLVRLWRKAAVAPAGASFLFAAAPGVSLAAAGAAALLVPSFTLGMAGARAADVLVVLALLLLSRAVLALAAHDAGSALAVFGGMRAMALGAAPVCLLGALVLALLSGGTNLDAAMAAVRDGGAGARWAGALAGLALLAGLARDPAIEAGFSGRALALAGLARQMRGVVTVALAVAVAAPFGVAAGDAGVGAWGVGLACWVPKLGVAGLAAAALAREPMLPAAGAVLAVIAVAVAAVQGVA